MLQLQDSLFKKSESRAAIHPVNPLLEYPLTKDYQRDGDFITVPSKDFITVPSKDYITEEEALKGKPLKDIKETVSVELSTVRLKGN